MLHAPRSERLREEHSEPSERLREEHLDPSERLREEHSEPSERLREEHLEPSERLREEHLEPSERLREEHLEPSELLREEHSEPSERLREEHSEPSERLREEHSEPSERLREEHLEPSERLREEHSEPSERLREEHSEPSERLDEKPARPADPGAVLLLSAYELGHQPLGLTLPAALLREAGFAPRLLDLSTDRLREDWVSQARLIGISVPMHTALVLGVRAAGRVRELNPDCHICFYGLYATLNQDYLLKRDSAARLADSVIGGECEPPLVQLAQALTREAPRRMQESARLELPGVGVSGRPAPPHLARIAWRIPARDGLRPLEQYGRLLLPMEDGEQERVAGYAEATRGCKHRCLHCPIPPVYSGRFFAVPRAFVLQDIERQVRQGARHICFGDPDFLNGPGHALAIVRGLRAAHPGVTFDFTAKIEHLLRYRDLLPELKRCGALFVVSAVESLSDTVLGHLDKGHTRSDVTEALALLRQTGLVLRPTFVPFTPWSALTDYLDLLNWVRQEGLQRQVAPVQLTLRLLVPPGSALLGTPQFAAVRSRLDEAAFTYRWEHPDPRMDSLHAQAQRLVEQAEQEGWPPERAFAALERVALALARSDERPRAHPRPARPSLPAPRLKESWFC